MTDKAKGPKPYVSIQSTARKAIIFHLAWVGATILVIPTEFILINALHGVSDDQYFFGFLNEEAEFANNLWLSATLVQLIIGLIATILFFIWFYKAYRNLPALGAMDLRFSPVRAIVYFFIPIISLWKPYQATEEIWKVSESPSTTSSRLDRNQMHLPQIVTIWWIVWVISNYAGWLVFRRGFSEDTVSKIISNTYLSIGNDVLIILSAILTVFIIRDITKMHSARGIMINTQGPPANPSVAIEGDERTSGDETTGRNVSGAQDFQSLKS